MKRTRLGLVIALSVALLVALVPAGTSTAGEWDTYIKLLDILSWSCTPGDWPVVSLEWQTEAGDTSTHYWYLENKRNGEREYEAVGPFTGPPTPGFGTYWAPVPAGTQPGDTLEYVVRATSDKYPGTISRLSFNCSTGEVLTRSFQLNIYDAVPTPAGFVLRSIACDTAVYDAPAGQPVGSDSISAGQTWFVNPTPVTGPDGQSWTEVFVAGPINVYIPTSCIGASAASY